MRFWKSNKGFVVPFKIVEADGTTPKDLTGITVKWYFKDRDGNAPTGSPITGVNQTPLANGIVHFTIPAGIFDNINSFKSQLNLSDGASYEEDAEIVQVDIDSRTKD